MWRRKRRWLRRCRSLGAFVLRMRPAALLRRRCASWGRLRRGDALRARGERDAAARQRRGRRSSANGALEAPRTRALASRCSSPPALHHRAARARARPGARHAPGRARAPGCAHTRAQPPTKHLALTPLRRRLAPRSCPATAQRVLIPYADAVEPTYMQSISVRAADAGWRGAGAPLSVIILPVRLRCCRHTRRNCSVLASLFSRVVVT
jgi:hypothetical protein